MRERPAPPTWIDVASNDSLVKSSELAAWMGYGTIQGLAAFIERTPDFPAPRFRGRGGARRWRVGDIRAWLRGGKPTPFQISTVAEAASSANP